MSANANFHLKTTNSVQIRFIGSLILIHLFQPWFVTKANIGSIQFWSTIMSITKIKFKTFKVLAIVLLIVVVCRIILLSVSPKSTLYSIVSQKIENEKLIIQPAKLSQLTSISDSLKGMKPVEKRLSGLNQQLPQLQFSPDSPRVGVIAYVPYRDNQYFTIQFLSLLYSSWKYIITHSHLASSVKIPGYHLPKQLVVVDMLVWCAERSCKEMPKDCKEFRLPHEKTITPQCFYFSKEEHPDAKSNGWANSFVYITDPTFSNLTSTYDYFIRLDTDTLLAPGFLVWLPNSSVAIGEAHYCGDFNKKRLEEIARKLNIPNQKVHCIGSSWYAKADIMQKLSEEVVRLTFHLIKHEFDPKLPGLEGLFKDNTEGVWPTWWRGVSTLYGSEMALNAIVPNLTDCCWTKGLLDQGTCNEQSILEVVQLHCYHGACQFRKFDFVDAIISLRNSRTLDPRLFLFHSDRDVTNMSLRDYTMFIAWYGSSHYVQHIRAWVMSALGEKFIDDGS